MPLIWRKDRVSDRLLRFQTNIYSPASKWTLPLCTVGTVAGTLWWSCSYPPSPCWHHQGGNQGEVFPVTVNADMMSMLRLILLMIVLAMKMMIHLLVMISTVETTHIGARSPGPDTEVGICSDALQKEMNIIKTLFRFQFQELMKLYQFWKGIENIWNILFFHNSINKRSFNLELNLLARCLRREVDPLNKMVVGVSWRGGAVGQKDQFLPQMPSPSVCLMSPYNRTRPKL